MNTVSYKMDTFIESNIIELRDAISAIKEPMQREQNYLQTAEAMLGGKVIINMAETIKKGGRFKNEFPKLALAQANLSRVWCYKDDLNFMRFSTKKEKGAFYRLNNMPVKKDGYAETIVPFIPPAIRPETLDDHHILFEVAQWKVAPMPVVDPILCKRISGDVFVVEAIWDMTPLEAFASGL